jgi:hypothetical protein
MRVLPWYCTRDFKLCVAWTLLGVVRIKANTFAPPFAALRSRKLLGYSVLVGSVRVSWTPDLTTAFDVAENIVTAEMSKRRDEA